MFVAHSGITYECDLAVRCGNDKYIKLYLNDEEIAAFYGISDFSEYTISGGSFVDPCDCESPILLKTYIVKGCTISPTDWISTNEETERYYYAIERSLISGNTTTCNIMLNFAETTSITYAAEQADGRVIIYVEDLPAEDIIIDSIQVTRT